MKKTVIAGLTALALMAPSMSFAQQTTQGGGEHEHYRPSAADLKALTDARVAALKTGLQLTPEQEKNWPPVEQAIRDMAQARQARVAEWREHGKSEDAIAKLRTRADALAQRSTELKKLADAAAPLYGSLSDEQKHRLRFLVRMVMEHHRGHHGWRHRG
ncbi:MAG: Spy/CpxP family protein refolding chaperone [Rhodomicrobium sp.]